MNPPSSTIKNGEIKEVTQNGAQQCPQLTEFFGKNPIAAKVLIDFYKTFNNGPIRIELTNNKFYFIMNVENAPTVICTMDRNRTENSDVKNSE